MIILNLKKEISRIENLLKTVKNNDEQRKKLEGQLFNLRYEEFKYRRFNSIFYRGLIRHFLILTVIGAVVCFAIEYFN